jgi:hypothetical protein
MFQKKIWLLLNIRILLHVFFAKHYKMHLFFFAFFLFKDFEMEFVGFVDCVH